MLKAQISRRETVAVPVVTDTTSTLEAFIKAVMKYAKAETDFKCYRGQRNVKWKNVPGLLRPGLSKLEENEKRAIRDLITVHPNEFSDDQTMFDRLVRMQHFGLPTRLMDVSLNPLVALYFATDPGPDGEHSDGVVTAFSIPKGREKYFDSDSVSCLANLANLTKEEKNAIINIRENRTKGVKKSIEVRQVNGLAEYHRLQQFIRAEKPHFLPNIDPIDLFKPYYVHPKMSNRRILAQSGGFIIHGLEPPKSINFAQIIREKKFIIPQKSKGALRSALDLLGINESNLFPELDKAAKRIEARYTTI
ncbi:hypothetical protein ACOSOMT5_P1671 [Acidiphilium sp. MT5]